LGRTKQLRVTRNTFFSPSEIYEAVSRKIEKTLVAGLRIDYLTFVPIGEPAHDKNLGTTLKLLKSFGIKIAVISNASMLAREDVKKDFLLADYISLKIDTLRYETWLNINRPNTHLEFEKVIKGIEDFKKIYQGALCTETMFVKDINDNIEEAELLTDYIAKINPDIAYMAFPIRPPAEKWVEIPDETDLVKFYRIFAKKINRVEYLINYGVSHFGSVKNDIKTSLLNNTSVHPKREDDLKNMLEKAREDENTINELIIKNQIIKACYQGEPLYVG
jgi:wyosine [tRNA(Phe)-imidazoG37] synthetase (radical SAM superfamily)